MNQQHLHKTEIYPITLLKFNSKTARFVVHHWVMCWSGPVGERMSPPVMATNCAVRTRRLGSGEAMAPYTYSTHYSLALVIHVKTL